MTTSTRTVIGGVDTHKHTHYAAVIDMLGRLLGHQEFPATDRGYTALLGWVRTHGVVEAIGVESTGAYGATLTRYLTGAGMQVIEVNRPNTSARRRQGKSDRLDAEQIARAVLADEATATPKAKSGMVEAIRTLRITRASAVKARTQAFNALFAVVISAPSPLRDELVVLSHRSLVNRCLRLRPETEQLLALADQPERLMLASTKTALRELARRFKSLDTEAKALHRQIHALVTAAAPELLALCGVGVELAAQFLITAGDNPDRIHTEAAFARLCGVAPQPATSGQITGRHRLSRGGDRAANSALYMVTIVRMRHHPPTRAYLQRRTAEGRSKRDIIRCLKRYIAREVYSALPTTIHTAQLPNAA